MCLRSLKNQPQGSPHAQQYLANTQQTQDLLVLFLFLCFMGDKEHGIGWVDDGGEIWHDLG